MRIKFPVRGLVASPPMPIETMPGLKGWLPPYHVQHAPLSMSQIPAFIQGTPRRQRTRAGVRPAFPESTPPPVFSFLLAHVNKTPQGSVGPRVLVAQVQPPIGVIH